MMTHLWSFVLAIYIACTCAEILVKDDQFIGFFNQMYQKLTADNGRQYERPSTPTKIELLANDQFYPDELSTCANKRGVTNVENKDVKFEEIAKAAGFHHVHRDTIPTRPHCQFDYIIPARGNGTSVISNELCIMEMLTGGSAVGDYDNDGHEDIFFSVFNTRSLLYRNNGDGTFTDVTESANVGPVRFGNGAGWVDVDSDGDLDLFVTTVGDVRHYLYINHGGYFTEEAQERGVSMRFENDRKLSGFTPNFGDFDQDGFIDIYVSEWMIHSAQGKVSAARLLKNMGASKPGYFMDVTDSAGVNMDDNWRTFRNEYGSGTHTFGSSFTDFDNDGWPELLITGDFGQSRLFWNNKNGTFTKCTEKCIGALKDAMGHGIGDLNHDGYMDAFISAVYWSKASCRIFSCAVGAVGNGLFMNNQNKTFDDIAIQAGVHDGHWAWGAALFDFNNDGYLDVVSTNGFDSTSTTLDDEYGKDNMQLFRNHGDDKNIIMTDEAKDRGMNFNGLGRGLLVFDFENDGDLDVVVAANVGPPKLFKNTGGNQMNWLRVKVLHVCLTNNKRLCDSYGARVQLKSKSGMIQTSLIGSNTHFLGQSETTAHFGLGENNDNVTVTVFWPRSEKRITLNNVMVNQKLRVTEPEGVINQTLEAVSIQVCPTLKIKSITTQPDEGQIIINNDQTSVAFNPGKSLFDIGVQHFKYLAEVSPPTIPSSTVEGVVTLDFRVNINIYPKCTNGRANIAVNQPMNATNERRFDGFSNNMDEVHWGSTVEDLIRLAPQAYADNVSEPAGACSAQQTVTKTCPYPMELSGIGSNRPPAREISNTLMAQTQDLVSRRNMSDFTMHYGQFLAHDTDHSSPLPRYEFQYHPNHVWMPITIPKGDIHFDPYSTGKETMGFVRSAFNRCTGHYPGNKPRKQFNQISAYLDASMIYGMSLDRCEHLREHKNGRLKIGSNLLLPKNTAYLPNENPTGRPSEQLYVAGDIRANVQPGLMSLHALFVREHNRLAHQYKLKNPTATDEEIFQKARRYIIAEIQSITYNEYLPAVLGGKQHIPTYAGYKDNVDVSISNEFATAAFRFGHSQVNSHIFRLQKDNTPIKEGHALLRDTYFKPNRLELEGGVDPIFRGAFYFPAQEIDLKMVDEMRNTLFPTSAAAPGKQTGFDLASLNIQRGRDHGLSDLNTVRKSMGMKTYTSFEEITKHKDVAMKLKELYTDLSTIDLWVGGLAEDHVKNSELGETFHAIITEQFTRLRDGDRFWYESILTEEELKMIKELTFSKIIKMNTGIDDCPKNVFFSQKNCIDVKDHQCIPKPMSNEAYELKLENDKLKEEHTDKSDKIDVLIAVTCVLGALCFITLILAIKMATMKKKENQKSEPQLTQMESGKPEKFVLEIGQTNPAAEA